MDQHFLDKLNREYLWYNDQDLYDLMMKYGLSQYIQVIKENGPYRMYPSEVIKVIEEYNTWKNSNLPLVDASRKEIPDFLLKKSN